MAVASVKTLLPLDTFFRVLGMHPLHGNQIYLAGLPAMGDERTNRTCDVPIFQYAWQTADRIGREDLAEAIASAEDRIFNELGYKTAPDWTVGEEVAAARPANPSLFSLVGRDIRNFQDTIRTKYGYVTVGGVRATSVVQAGAAIVYSDPDGDGYNERATVTVATTVTEPSEIRLFYPGKAGDESWEIRPLTSVTISGGNATIVLQRAQLVAELEFEKLFPSVLLGTTDALFLSTVDVYRVYNDPSNMAELQWFDVGCASCGNSGCLACTYDTQTGCIITRDKRLGVISVRAATWDAVDQEYDSAYYVACRAPDRLKLNYQSGLSLRGGTMDLEWARAISYLAVTALDRPLCSCQPVENAIKHWSEDLAHNVSTQASTSSFQLSRGRLENPWGTTRGAIYAWDLVQKRKIGGAAIHG